MTGRYILDNNGNAVEEPDLMKWATWLEKNERHVARDELGGGIVVSTVFLALDHSFSDGATPVLWETMILGGSNDQYQERYTSLEDAKNGHEIALNLAKGV